MARRKRFGELSKQARNRAALAGKEYGLSRNAVAKRYNRGTYNPLSTDPVKRLPREVRQHADTTGQVDWRDLALDNMRAKLSDYFKYNDDAVVFLTQSLNENAARVIAMATEDELLQYASIQPDSEGKFPPVEDWGLPPGITLNDVTVRVGDERYNVFWYH